MHCWSGLTRTLTLHVCCGGGPTKPGFHKHVHRAALGTLNLYGVLRVPVKKSKRGLVLVTKCYKWVERWPEKQVRLRSEWTRVRTHTSQFHKFLGIHINEIHFYGSLIMFDFRFSPSEVCGNLSIGTKESYFALNNIVFFYLGFISLLHTRSSEMRLSSVFIYTGKCFSSPKIVNMEWKLCWRAPTKILDDVFKLIFFYKFYCVINLITARHMIECQQS